jgi:hypothetical protein
MSPKKLVFLGKEKPPEADTSIWKEYVDGMAHVLRTEARQAGVFDHPTLTGSAREWFVKRFLRQLLPEMVGVTAGKAFDRYGKKSKQIDVLIHDRAFPVLKIGGQALVPADGVIAGMEVKSRLDRTSLRQSLENGASLMALRGQFQMLKDVGGVEIRTGPPSLDAIDRHAPGFYVLGFEGYESGADRLRQHLYEWIQERRASRFQVPRVVATPGCLGLRKRDDIRIAEGDGKGEAIIACTCSESALNVLVADLLEKVLRRTTFIGEDFVLRSMTDYFDPNHYMERHVEPGESGWRLVSVEEIPPGW